MQIATSLKSLFIKPPESEKRSATVGAAGAASSFLSLFMPTTKSKIAVNAYNALSISALSCAIRCIAEGLASLSFEIYEQDKNQIKPARNHDLYYLISKEPNAERYSTFMFIRTLITNANLYGNGYAKIHRAGSGRPENFTILDPTQVETIDGPDGKLYYTVKNNSKEGVETLLATDVIHISALSLNGISGIDLIKRNAENLGISLASTDFAAAFFGNGAHVGGVLSHPGKLQPETVDRLRLQFNQKYSGTENAGATAVLTEGMTYQKRGNNPSEAMLVENRKFQVQEMARLYRVPLHMIYEMEGGASFSSIEVMDTAFVKHTLRIWAKMIEAEFDSKIFTTAEKRGGKYYTRFNIDSMLRGDSKARAELYATLFDRGALSSNDIRALENLNPRPGGDEYYTPLNFTSTPNEKPNET